MAHSNEAINACRDQLEYAGEPVSGFQRGIRGGETVLKDHICKTMNELNMRRCSLVPKNTPGADWRALVLHVQDNPADESFNVRNWCIHVPDVFMLAAVNTADPILQWLL